MTKRRAWRGSSSRSIPASHGRSSAGPTSIGGLASGRIEPARTSTVRVRRRCRSARSTASATVSAAARRGPRPARRSRPGRPARRPPASPAAPANVREGRGQLADGRRRRRPRPEPSGQPGATRRPQTMTMPGPCQSSSGWAMSRQAAARGCRSESGGSSRSPITSTAAAQRRRRRIAVRRAFRVGARRVGPAVSDVAAHAGSIVSPSGARPLLPMGRICLAGRRRWIAVKLAFRAHARLRGRPDQLALACRRTARPGRGARPWSSTSTGCSPTPPGASTSSSGAGGTGPPSSRPAATTR